MQAAMITEKPGNTAISDRFRAGRTYRGRIKDDHKIDPYRGIAHSFIGMNQRVKYKRFYLTCCSKAR